MNACNTVFNDPGNTHTYPLFKDELEKIYDSAKELGKSEGGVNTEEEFEKYHKCSEDVLKTLKDYIPRLLKKEDFFIAAFTIK